MICELSIQTINIIMVENRDYINS